MRHFILVFTLFIACSAQPKKDSLAQQKKISISQTSFISSVIIYSQDEFSILSEVTAKANEILKEFKRTAEIPDSITIEGYQVSFSKAGETDFEMPDPEEMSYAMTDLSEDEIKSLPKTKSSLTFVFFGTQLNVLNKQRAINQFVYAMMENKKAIAYDLSTVEFFGPVAWKEHRIENLKDENPNMTGQVNMHVYREDEFCRVITMGMSKFALPEISVKNFTCSDSNPFGNLVNAAIQTLYENPFINGDSTLTVDLRKIRNKELQNFLVSNLKAEANQLATINLRSVEPEEGDNPSPQLLIAFTDAEKGSPQMEANAVIDSLFGWEDAIDYTAHDEELLKASGQAKRQLPKLKKLFLAGLEPGYSIMVKVPFKTPSGGNEWMWVEVTKWKTSKMEGILQNEPFEIPDLKVGTLVNYDEADIFDYLLNKPDGSYEGNETGKIIEKRER